MSDRFSPRPDDTWHAEMRSRYGDVVPQIERLRIRRGLQDIVHDLFEKLRDADRFNACRIHSASTRNAGFSVIDVRFSAAATEADKRMCGRIIECIQERLNAACEHCGKPGAIIAKSGLETLLDDPNAVLGDRLLCAECYQNWSHA
jgi:hypothetical protein